MAYEARRGIELSKTTEALSLRLASSAVEMKFRKIEPGEFRMGSRGRFPDEEPVHLVKITQPFWLGETPVTQEQFAVWTDAEGIGHKNQFGGRPNHPAENLTWRDAITYCAWLGKVTWSQLPKDSRFACLPTEAEWEYACRAKTETEFYSGDGEEALRAVGWFGEGWASGSTKRDDISNCGCSHFLIQYGYESSHDRECAGNRSGSSR